MPGVLAVGSALRQVARAASASAWTPLPVTFNRPVRQGVAAQELAGHVTLPGGEIRSVELRLAGPTVAAALRASDVLWVAGEPNTGRRPTGVLTYIGLTSAKFGRARQ